MGGVACALVTRVGEGNSLDSVPEAGSRAEGVRCGAGGRVGTAELSGLHRREDCGQLESHLVRHTDSGGVRPGAAGGHGPALGVQAEAPLGPLGPGL